MQKPKTRKPTNKEWEEADWFFAFAEPVRLRILRVLVVGGKNLKELAKECGLAHTNGTNLVNRLERAGLVVTVREGVHRRCTLADDVKVTKNTIEFTHPSGCKVVVPRE